jgi:hypothetical protein
MRLSTESKRLPFAYFNVWCYHRDPSMQGIQDMKYPIEMAKDIQTISGVASSVTCG